MESHARLVFVTGLSGAGLGAALKILEDFGFETFDNMPLDLISQARQTTRDQAFVLDTRARGFSPEAVQDLTQDLGAYVLFLNCSNAVLLKRYSETRRAHPMAKDRPIADGIAQEGKLLKPLQSQADMVLDTSELSVHDLKKMLEPVFHPNPTNRQLNLTVMSFGFKNGLPREADMVLDVRFLKNPHWDKDLRAQTGLDRPVQKYITNDAALAPFLVHTQGLLETLLPRYTQEGKFYFTLAIGCTGGRHRSVYIAEQLAEILRKTYPNLSIRHRDL